MAAGRGGGARRVLEGSPALLRSRGCGREVGGEEEENAREVPCEGLGSEAAERATTLHGLTCEMGLRRKRSWASVCCFACQGPKTAKVFKEKKDRIKCSGY